MKRLVLALTLLCITARAETIAIRHVTIVDVNTGTLASNQTVVIDGHRIASIGRNAPKHARVIDGTGKFLIPGLWDMHVHWYDKRYLPLFIANGVTGIRQMWGNAEHRRWRQEMIGPRELIGSTIIDGPKPIWPQSIVVKDAAEGRAAVIAEKKSGADFIKVYSLLPRDAFFGIAEESKKQHIPFVGHVPSTVRASEASDAGMKSMEHLLGILLESSTNEEAIRKDLVAAAEEPVPASALMRVSRQHAKESIETYDPAKAAALFARFVKNGTWHCPTLTVNRAVAYMDDPSFTSDPRVRYMPSSIRAFWDPKNDFRFKELTPEDFANRKRTFAKLIEITGAMQKAGVGILAGTDTLNPYCFPGFSLHDELALLVQAGLTSLQALQAATRNAARFLESDDYGGVAKGKMADLVLLDANPLQDIHNTTKIAGVIFNGKYFSRSDLDDMLSAVEKIEGK